MRLKKLLERLDYKVIQGSDDIEVTALANDSRKAEKGSALSASAAQSLTVMFMPKK